MTGPISDDEYFLTIDFSSEADDWSDVEPELEEATLPELPSLSSLVQSPAAHDAESTPSEIPASLLEKLNPAQRKAVETLSGPLLVVAGPGSGKTRVLTHRIAALLATGHAKPWEILAVTFTNKAAAEMRTRLEHLVGPAAQDMWVATFHSACVRILRANAAEARLPRSFSIVDASDAQRLVKAVLVDLGMPAEKSDVKDASGLISKAKNAAMTPQTVSSVPSMAWVAPVMYAYNERLEEMGAVDFDDILLRTLSTLRQHAHVAERYQQKFRHVLVDEYQDTNQVQYQIVQILGESGNVCVVGDADQSVYSWRGAEPAVMESFPSDFPGGRVVVLEQNYRSTQAILEVCQAVIDPNPSTNRPRLFTSNAKGAPVRLYVAEDDRDEASWIVGEIKKTPINDSTAVLMRTNSQTRSLEEELTRQALAYSVVGALRFYDRAEVKDALSYLRLAVNPADSISFARCINTPRRGIGDATATAVVDLARARKVDVITALRDGLADGSLPKRATKALTGFLAVYERILEAAHLGPAPALRAVSEAAGLRAALEADKSEGPDRVANFDELVNSAASFLSGPSPTRPEVQVIGELDGIEQTLAYLENVALVSSADSDDDEDAPAARRVILLTAHSSKGKEFDHVWVAGVENTLFPHKRSIDDSAAMAEERRLLFVACSRARQTLALSRCHSRMSFGKIVENEPSPFLEDLPSSVQVIRSPRRRGQHSGGGFSGGYGGGYRPASMPSGYGGYTGGTSRISSPKPRVASTPLPVQRPMPSGPRLAPSEVSVSDRVNHKVFGVGVIEEVDGTRVTIAFPAPAGKKILDLSMAPLEKA